jgi:hypothetical protein
MGPIRVVRLGWRGNSKPLLCGGSRTRRERDQRHARDLPVPYRLRMSDPPRKTPSFVLIIPHSSPSPGEGKRRFTPFSACVGKGPGDGGRRKGGNCPAPPGAQPTPPLPRSHVNGAGAGGQLQTRRSALLPSSPLHRAPAPVRSSTTSDWRSNPSETETLPVSVDASAAVDIVRQSHRDRAGVGLIKKVSVELTPISPQRRCCRLCC